MPMRVIPLWKTWCEPPYSVESEDMAKKIAKKDLKKAIKARQAKIAKHEGKLNKLQKLLKKA